MDEITFKKAQSLYDKVKSVEHKIVSIIEKRGKGIPVKRITIEYIDYSDTAKPIVIEGIGDAAMNDIATEIQGKLNQIESEIKKEFEQL